MWDSTTEAATAQPMWTTEMDLVNTAQTTLEQQRFMSSKLQLLSNKTGGGCVICLLVKHYSEFIRIKLTQKFFFVSNGRNYHNVREYTEQSQTHIQYNNHPSLETQIISNCIVMLTSLKYRQSDQRPQGRAPMTRPFPTFHLIHLGPSCHVQKLWEFQAEPVRTLAGDIFHHLASPQLRDSLPLPLTATKTIFPFLENVIFSEI